MLRSYGYIIYMYDYKHMYVRIYIYIFTYICIYIYISEKCSFDSGELVGAMNRVSQPAGGLLQMSEMGKTRTIVP